MIAKNNTETNLAIYVALGKNIEIPALGQIDLLDSLTRYEIANSDIPYHLHQGDITLNDGDKDLDELVAIRWAYNAPPADEKRDKSGKLRVHQTSRKLGTRIMWTGTGDDSSNPAKVGGGEAITLVMVSGTNTLSKYIGFNIVENETWLHEGYLTWNDCQLDTLTLDMVPRVTTTSGSSNTNYNLYGGYLIVPAAGNGTIEVTSDITDHYGGLVYMPNDDLDNPPTAFWDAEWNKSTGKYENITPAPYGTGRYNMFAIEVVLARFVNAIPLLRNGFIALNSSDTDQMGDGMSLKMTGHTNTETAQSHDWSVAVIMCLHRERSV